MPNHITNELVLTPDAYEALTRPSRPEDRSLYGPPPARVVDFNLVIPGRPDDDWYNNWSINNWGTKWNAYKQIAEPKPQPGDLLLVRFDTAWSHPFPIVRELARRFPDDPIYVRWADEDLGSNMGAYVVLGSESVDGVMLQRDDAGALPADAVEWIAAQEKVDVSRCIDMAAPAEYSRERSDAQNYAARAWAHLMKYEEPYDPADYEEA